MKKINNSNLKNSSLKNEQLLETCGQEMLTGMRKKHLIAQIKEKRGKLFNLDSLLPKKP